MVKGFIILLFTCLTTVANAIDVKDVLSKMKEQKNLSYSMTYELFKGHKSTTVHSSYKGEYYSYEGQAYQKINSTEFVYADVYTLQVNHEEKIMSIGKSMPVQRDIDIDAVLEECSSSELKEKGGYYEVIFRFKSTSEIPCSIIKLRIDKKGFLMLQLDMYYSTHQDFSPNWERQDLAQPHLRIIYNEIKKVKKNRPDLFELSNYVSIDNSTITPNGIYQGYELIDNRNI